jgi:hypothetical protein
MQGYLFFTKQYAGLMTDITRSQVTDAMTCFAPVHEQETNHRLGQGTTNPTQSERSEIEQRVEAHGSARSSSGRMEPAGRNRDNGKQRCR